jgi:hypothetical protein
METVSSTQMPVEVGDIEVDSQGHVRARDQEKPIRFSFVYLGITFYAVLAADRDGPLELTGVIGTVPYSAETLFGRRVALTILSMSHLPRGRLWMDEGMRIHLSLTAVPPRPRTPVTVLSTATALLMDVKPHLDLLGVALRRPRRALRS